MKPAMVMSCFASVLLLASLPALACSWGRPDRRLEDEIRAYYDAEVVFLARIGKVAHEAPSDSRRFWMFTAPYQILETYRGAPDRSGVVTTEDGMRPGRDGAPPDSCTGGGIGPESEGQLVLVYANKLPERQDTVRYKLDRFQTMGMSNCKGCEDFLARMRLYAKFENTP